MNNDFEMVPNDWDTTNGAIIKVIGVGGGGNNAVNHMADMGIAGVDFIVCNTDGQSLQKSPIKNKIQLGSELTRGRGAGCDPEVGKDAAVESMDKITAMLQGNTEMVFITAGMGGGTGTGAAPIIAQAAKEMGILTVAIVTLPFKDEGSEPQQRALEGINQLKNNVDSLLLISNNKLYEMYGDLTLRNAFQKADEILATAAKGIAEIITKPGYINVDFADVKKVMRDSGVALLGAGSASGDNRAVRAVESALTSPLLNNNSIKGATNILVNITSPSGANEIKLSEVGDITNYIKREAGSIENMKRGVVYDESEDDRINVTIVATGFKMRDIPELYSEQKVEKVTLDEDEYRQQSIEFSANKNQEISSNEFELKVNEANESDTVESQPIAAAKSRKLTGLEKNQVTYIESVPAYKRKNIEIKNQQQAAQDVSNETIEESNGKGFVIRKNNAYLNPEVD